MQGHVGAEAAVLPYCCRPRPRPPLPMTTAPQFWRSSTTPQSCATRAAAPAPPPSMAARTPLVGNTEEQLKWKVLGTRQRGVPQQGAFNAGTRTWALPEGTGIGSRAAAETLENDTYNFTLINCHINIFGSNNARKRFI